MEHMTCKQMPKISCELSPVGIVIQGFVHDLPGVTITKLALFAKASGVP